MHLNVPSYFPSCTYQDPGIRWYIKIYKTYYQDRIYIYIITHQNISRSTFPQHSQFSPSRPLGRVFQQLLGHVPGRPRVFAKGQRCQGQLETTGHGVRVALALQDAETSVARFPAVFRAVWGCLEGSCLDLGSEVYNYP